MIDRKTADALDDALALLFYGFRGVTAEPDRMLAERGLSRVHHRILYFVRRNPGLGPGDLVRILRVSKQALARPLKDLLVGGLVAAAPVPENRRRKALRLTPSGARLERRLSGSQRRRFASVFGVAGGDAAEGWRSVMALLSGTRRGPHAPASGRRQGRSIAAARRAPGPRRAATPGARRR
ncbi:MarR family winged helix-turn-helix transcriptional regulator [Anaeromyxobacter oryzisoli]|uniref:MarR family winged helix-turn-helix transcriptional regulator n=1 Tax=Anaeromyxobacter oryzisoli TaxID=2925408 RepID=UPI001F58966B|nr:MarR family winged helix-turn-helix transcriptional regulator [Anaeromyxobacter sp. SG63]